MVQQSKKKSSLLILGAGHLVRPLLRQLADDFLLTITTTGAPKFPLAGLYHFPLRLPLLGEEELTLPPCDKLLISLPPRALRALSPKNIVGLCGKRLPSRVVFISSLSVYGEQENADEKTPPLPRTENGKLLLEIEGTLRAHLGERLTIIRPGGLLDRDRHPGKYLAGSPIADPLDRIHLIQEDDLRLVLREVLTRAGPLPEILNMVHPDQEQKIIFYSRYCARMGLPAPRPAQKPKVSSRSIHSSELQHFMPDFNFSSLDS